MDAKLAYAVTDMRLLQVAQTLRWLIAEKSTQEVETVEAALEHVCKARTIMKRSRRRK